MPAPLDASRDGVSPSVDDQHELILYAVPEGSFAADCARYWASTDAAARSTQAQTYPPHCTLTGFFWRAPSRVDAVVDDLERAVPDRRVPGGVVTGRLEAIDDWVGFTLDAPVFARATASFVDAHTVEAGEDALRPKSWPHLSLAYGDGTDTGWHHRLALEVFDSAPTSPWRIGLWRRADGDWMPLGGGGW